VAPLAEKRKIQLEVKNDADPEVFIDRDRMVQVFINLLSNAIKFSPDGKNVTVSTSDGADYAEVSVTDEGRGVSKEMQETIFERFKQADSRGDRKKGGTGLGLAITKAIVERHHGTLGVESTPGQGSRFWVRLPKKNGRQS